MLAALTAASLSGCILEDEASAPDEAAIPQSLAERVCPDDSVLSFEDFGGPFVITWCTTCHSSQLPVQERADAPMGVDFDTLDGIRSQAGRIWARAADHNITMPPVAGPDDIDRELLGEWLACGAPATGDVYGD
jgi:uncharacterized membrane protein